MRPADEDGVAVKLDRRARSPRWANDGKHIFFLAGVGAKQTWTVKVEGDDLREVFRGPERSEPQTEQYWRGRPFQISSFSLDSRS